MSFVVDQIMKIQRLFIWLGLFIMAFTVTVGCSPTPSAAPTAPSSTTITLTVSAAASLQEALEAIEPVFEQANPTIQLNHNFGASGVLQQQIEQGAPTDIFISAATKQMDALQAKDLILADTRRNVLTNHLVLIVPKNSNLDITEFRQLGAANVDKIAVGEPRSVPAGQYADEVLHHLGIADALTSKLVFANSVKGVLAAVESGNADAGIVYETDAKVSDQVKVVAIADEPLHQPIVYPIAVVKRSPNPDAAEIYSEFLFSNPAQEIFQQFGFGQPVS